MLTLTDVTKRFGDFELLDHVSLQVNRGERIGLVGPNGAGKSTLLDLILGRQEPDSGTISFDRRCTAGFLPQETAAVGDETVLEIALAFQPRTIPSGAAAATRHPAAPSSVVDLELPDFQLEAKAKQILNGLGFRPADFERPARELSGGWIMRAHLARLLVQEPDLLLLDEPTNHLDLHSLLWFQAHLQKYPGAILMVSHDREFLNQIVQSIVELRSGQLIEYRGNYDAFVTQREAQETNQLAAFKNQQKEIKRLMLFVDRFRAKNTKASQAQSKLKQIARMEKIEAPAAATSTIDFNFPQPQRSGLKVIKLEHVSFGYDTTTVYRDLNFEVERGQKTVLVGPNGAGKSTLLKLLAGLLPITQGERICGHNMRSGYYAQNRIDMLRLDRTVLEEALDTPDRVTEQFVRTLLGCFLFSGDDVLKPVRVLSGGEKSRLALVKLLLHPPNFLLMDEPTTHLDMASIEALIYALKQFAGTIVFISHDVYFIRELANHTVHVENGAVMVYPGPYDYYLEKRAALTVPAPTAPRTRPASDYRQQRRLEAEARQAQARQRRHQQKIVADLETQIGQVEQRQNEITQQLQDQATYADGQLVVRLNQELRALTKENEQLHREWEAAAHALEAGLMD